MSEWRVVSGSFSPEMHMALDEVITKNVAEGAAPTLRVWEWDRPAVVLGRFQSVRDEVFEEMAEKHNVQIVRRSTGGGAMFCEPGTVITYSLSLPESMVETDDIVRSYRELEEWSLSALNAMGVEAAHKPVNDIVHGKQKMGGSAQARRNNAVLHHTMMAYDLDIEKMLRVLRIGKEKISDKAIKSAEKAVSPIRTVKDVPREEVVDSLIEHFSEGRSITEGKITRDEIAEAEELAKDKYASDSWLYTVDREIENMEEKR